MKINFTDEQAEAMKKLYGQFVKPGDLVFNVGANVGTRTQIFVDLGAEVVAFEPQPELADGYEQLYALYRESAESTGQMMRHWHEGRFSAGVA